MGVASKVTMIAEGNLGPEIFLALVLWNGECVRFHILCTGGTNPCQRLVNIRRSSGITDKNVCAIMNK